MLLWSKPDIQNTAMPQVDLLILVLEDQLMSFRMVLLILVDKIRSKLLSSLTHYDDKRHAHQSTPSKAFDVSRYIDDDTLVLTTVDQKLLASMVVFTCVMARTHCMKLSLDSNIVEVRAGANENNIMFEGSITLNDLLEMAEQAEVDHVIDFLLRDNVTLNRYQ